MSTRRIVAAVAAAALPACSSATGPSYSPDIPASWAAAVTRRLETTITEPPGRFAGCIQTEDWNGLEPAVREYKYYCPDTGPVLDTNLRGGPGRADRDHRPLRGVPAERNHTVAH